MMIQKHNTLGEKQLFDFDKSCCKAPIKDLEKYQSTDDKMLRTSIFFRDQLKEVIDEAVENDKKLLYQIQLAKDDKQILRKQYDQLIKKSLEDHDSLIQTLSARDADVHAKNEEIVQYKQQIEHLRASLEQQKQANAAEQLKLSQSYQSQSQIQLLSHKSDMTATLNQITQLRLENQTLTSQLSAAHLQVTQLQAQLQALELSQKALKQSSTKTEQELNALKCGLAAQQEQEVKIPGLLKGITFHFELLQHPRQLGQAVLKSYRQTSEDTISMRLVNTRRELDQLKQQTALRETQFKQMIVQRQQMQADIEHLQYQRQLLNVELNDLKNLQSPENVFLMQKIIDSQRLQLKNNMDNLKKTQSLKLFSPRESGFQEDENNRISVGSPQLSDVPNQDRRISVGSRLNQIGKAKFALTPETIQKMLKK
ncbi:Hypothetical_protein [Hexamita inflata]|uniref:Hypothetical_protein n=1 Tax=Hexamita inflata TaxID=28002 RepID=A0AA86PHB8_9EUKA|nr:Hypothetical protein HINF_LOCUS23497 [Hexamita inflata]